ncbi:MAG TPA: glycoside hydrolase family 3 N-terminal domain-containing protein [Thermoleophilaceae bacterium]
MGRLRSRQGLIALAAVAVAAVAAGIAVGGGGGKSKKDAEPAGSAQKVSFLARIVPPPEERHSAAGPRVPSSIADLVRRLPLDRKVAQLFLWGFRGQDLTSDIYTRLRSTDLGGIVVEHQNYLDSQRLGQQAGEALVISQQAKHVPPWVMAPQQGGEFNAFPDLPPQDDPQDLSDAGQGGLEAAQAAAALRPLGVTGIIGPVLDVGSDEGAPPALGGLIYSDDPEEVAGFAEETVTAYRKARMFSVVAHFPGLGAADQDTQEAPATVGLSLSSLRSRDLVPFQAAFDKGAPAVLLSHALYAMDNFTRPASLSHKVATDLLRGELRYRGVAITDDLADPAITSSMSVPDAAVQALRAGADMLWISGPSSDQQAAYVAVLRAVQRRQVSRARLDQALYRVLIAKRQYGLIR